MNGHAPPARASRSNRSGYPLMLLVPNARARDRSRASPSAPGRRAQLVAILTDMIISRRQEQPPRGWCADERSLTNGMPRSQPWTMIL
jgi:hypothetical protein